MQYLAAIFGNFTLSWDLGIIVFLYLAAFFYGLSAGQRRLSLLLLSVYLSFVLISIAPYFDNYISEMPEYQRFVIESILFIALVIGIFFVISGSILYSSLNLPKKEEGQLWHLPLLSIVTVGFLISSILAFAPDLYYNNLSTITAEVFVFNSAHFWWALAGIATFVTLKVTKKNS